MFNDIRRGDIWFADQTMGPRDPRHRVIYGGRPVLVISANHINAADAIITVAPLTSRTYHAGPERVPVQPTKRNDLTRESLVLADQITTVDRSSLQNWVGIIDDEDMRQVVQAIKSALDL